MRSVGKMRKGVIVVRRSEALKYRDKIFERVGALRKLDASSVVRINRDLLSSGIEINDVFEGDDFIGTTYWLKSSPDDKCAVLCGDYL